MRTSRLAAVAPLFGAFVLVGALGAAVTVPVVAQDACADGLAQVEHAMTTLPVSQGDKDTLDSLVQEAKASKDRGDMQSCTNAVAQARAILNLG